MGIRKIESMPGLPTFPSIETQLFVVPPPDPGQVEVGHEERTTPPEEEIREPGFDGCQPLSGLPTD